MALADLIAQIDSEIAKLQQAKALLSGGAAPAAVVVKGKRGRPKGSSNAAKTVAAKKGKRTLSPEARKKIAEAQRARWAAQKKA